MGKVKTKTLKQNGRMKADCVKIVFSYSADLPHKYIQSHSCLYSELEKHLGLLFISISEMAQLW